MDLVRPTGAADLERIVADVIGAPDRHGRDRGAAIGSWRSSPTAALSCSTTASGWRRGPLDRGNDPRRRAAGSDPRDESAARAGPGELLVRVQPLDCSADT